MRAFLVALTIAMSSFQVSAGATPAEYANMPEARLSDARIEAAHKAFDLVYARWKAGSAPLDDVYVWSTRIRDSELDIQPMNRLDHDAVLRAHAERMQQLEKLVLQRSNRGLASAADVGAAAYYRAEADSRFANERIE